MPKRKKFNEWKPGGMGRTPYYGKRMRSTSVSINDDYYKAAKLLGNGSFSAGVREALSRHLITDEAPEKIV